MKKAIIIAAITLGAFNSQAQLDINGHFYGEDALKFNNYRIQGSAKLVGMGGAFTALGADISNSNLNPAGLGFYNKSEFSIGAIFGNYNTKSSYISLDEMKRASTDVKLGNIGAVFSSKGSKSAKKRSAWSISYANLANFQSDYSFNGVNQKSSITDYFAQRATNRGISSDNLDKEFNTTTAQAQNVTALAYQAFLIDPLANNKYEASELSIPVNQDGSVRTKGGLSQFNVSYGANYNNKTYLGLGIGIQNLDYTALTYFNEAFPKGKIFNGLNFYDELYVSGSGVNVSLGGIFKLSENIRVGASVISPTLMGIEESYIAGVKIDQKPNTFVTDYKEISTVPNDFNYRITSPLRASLGTALFLPKKLGVVSADLEYISYARMGLKDREDARWTSDQSSGVQNTFKDVLNVKLGTEIRIDKLRLRAGANLLGDPRRESANFNTKSYTAVGTLGLGIKTDRIYADLSFNIQKGSFAYTPYSVANTQDYASVKVNQTTSQVGINIGTFF